MKVYYVYILECSDASYYVGFTNNIERRLSEHNSGIYKKSYTYSRRPVIIKWVKEFNNPTEAIKVEKQIKGWSRKKKEALLSKNFKELVIFSKNYTENKELIDNYVLTFRKDLD